MLTADCVVERSEAAAAVGEKARRQASGEAARAAVRVCPWSTV